MEEITYNGPKTLSLYSISVDPYPHFISMLLDSDLIPLDVVQRWRSGIVLNTAKKTRGNICYIMHISGNAFNF